VAEEHTRRSGSHGATTGSETAGAQPGESPKERVDRELGELLEEIRVALPGIELLFGFLLVLPFSERFGALGDTQRTIYAACLLATAAATALLIAPTAHHRLGFRTLDKERLLIRTNRQVIGALVLVIVAVALAVALVVEVVFDATWAWGLATPIAIWFAAWWFVVPLWRRDHRRRQGAR
jgi:hypothetical protein